jgi:hypothetical protein
MARRHREVRITGEAVAILSKKATSIDDVIRTFQKWLHMPDTGPLVTMLAAVAANHMKGDPLWMFLVGPPASGKTEILDSLLGLPNMHPAATLTEASLLSGVPGRERAQDSSGGLLRAIGQFGIIVCKDFTSVLSMNREQRASLLAALREIYDGAWTRHVGTDGGRTLSWHGKVAVVGGVTPVIDAHHGVMSAMGERFLQFRLPDVNPKEQARSALRHQGKEHTMRQELRHAVSRLFADLRMSHFALDADAEERLAALATLVARCRSAVERDSYHREIDLVPGSERPARLVLALARLYSGMRSIGVCDGQCWPLLCRVGMDCIPSIRRSALDRLRRSGRISTPDVATAIGYPTTTVRRALEDLTAHGILEREKCGSVDIWELSVDAREWLVAAVVPQMSEDLKATAPEVHPEMSE